MPIGDPITPPLPVVGEAGTGYASKLLAFLEEVKTRLEAEVPVTALLEGTFDEANNPIVNLQYAGLYDQDGASTPPTGSLYRIGGNLWWVSAAGAFQVTNGAALNATSVNGFTGDYGSPNPAEARFVDLDQRYDFYDDYAGSAWAYVRARGFDVAGGATSLNRCRIAFGGVADYTLTLPAAVPAEATLLRMSTTGDVTCSNTVPGNITCADLRYTTEQTIRIHAATATTTSTGPTFNSGAWTVDTSTGQLWFPIPIRAGETIKNWSLQVTKGSATGTVTASLGYTLPHSTGGTTVGVAQTNSAAGPGNIFLTEAPDHAVVADAYYYIVFTGGGTAGDTVHHLEVNVTRP